jgi:hypothetical protein
MRALWASLALGAAALQAVEPDSGAPGKIILSKAAVQNVAAKDYWQFMNFTKPEYQVFAGRPAGQEHYKLLHYLSMLVPKSIVADIGTRYCTSAFALASELSNKVHSFDLPGDDQFEANIRELGLQMTPHEYLNHFPNIKFWKTNIMNDRVAQKAMLANILNDPDALKVLIASKVVLLDTLHFPETKPFEVAFIERMVSEGFSGIMVLDDIHLNAEMKRFWSSCVSGKLSELGRWNAYDVTDIGHATGTGILDFSKKLVLAD